MTLQDKCKVTIETNYKRYVYDDNTKHKFVTKEINVKYIQLIEDILYRLELMDKVFAT